MWVASLVGGEVRLTERRFACGVVVIGNLAEVRLWSR